MDSEKFIFFRFELLLQFLPQQLGFRSQSANKSELHPASPQRRRRGNSERCQLHPNGSILCATRTAIANSSGRSKESNTAQSFCTIRDCDWSLPLLPKPRFCGASKGIRSTSDLPPFCIRAKNTSSWLTQFAGFPIEPSLQIACSAGTGSARQRSIGQCHVYPNPRFQRGAPQFLWNPNGV